MNHRSLGDRAVALAAALAIVFVALFGAEPAPDRLAPLAHRAAR
jgi:hypothetical protein